MVTEVAESAIKKAVARAQQLAQGIDLLPARYVSAVQALPTLPSWRHIHEAHRRRAASTHSLFPETPRRQFSELREVYQGSATTPLHSYVFTFELLAAGNRIGSGVSRIYSAEAVGSASWTVEEDCLLDNTSVSGLPTTFQHASPQQIPSLISNLRRSCCECW